MHIFMEMKAFQNQTADIVKQPCIKYDKVCTKYTYNRKDGAVFV